MPRRVGMDRRQVSLPVGRAANWTMGPGDIVSGKQNNSIIRRKVIRTSRLWNGAENSSCSNSNNNRTMARSNGLLLSNSYDTGMHNGRGKPHKTTATITRKQQEKTRLIYMEKTLRNNNNNLLCQRVTML